MHRTYLIAVIGFGLISAVLFLFHQPPPRQLAGLEMVDIQPGKFDLTILVPNSLERNYYSRPVRILKPFQISKFEITIAQWNICFADGGCERKAKKRRYQSDDHPVTRISWHEAYLFTRWLSHITHDTYRLPTEEEWVYAAGAGKDYTRETIDRLIEKRSARLASGGGRSARTRKVGSNGVNDWQISDIDGSVWEWTLTCRFSSDDESRKQWTIKQLSDPNFCPNRIVQGVERAHVPYFVNEVISGGCGTGAPVDNIGFRVVKELAE